MKPRNPSQTIGEKAATARIFDELTGIRAIAAFMVFFCHYNVFFSERRVGSFIHSFVGEFYTGVTIFFVLSGFLICYRYYDNGEIRDKKWIVRYVKNRVARIYPVYFIATTLTFLMILSKSAHLDWLGLNARIVPWGGQGLSASHDVKLYLLNITFLRGFFSRFCVTGVGQGWSLTAEECFYFSAPFIFWFSRKLKLLTPFVIVFSAGLLGVFIFRNVDFYGFFGNFNFLLFYTFFGRCFEFFVGMKLALIFKNRQYNTGARHRTILGILWIIACLTAMVFVKGRQFSSGPEYEQYTSGLTYAELAINNFVLPIGIAILFLGLITEKTFVKSVLQHRILVLLGKSSYSFYLIHVAMINLLESRFTNNTAVIFLSICISSILVFKIVEEPCNKYIRSIDAYSFLRTMKARMGFAQ